MIQTFLYYALTFVEAVVGVFGVRSVYEQPRYAVIEHLPGGVEIRDYGPRPAVETNTADGESAAFGRLFQYITGANAASAKVAMTVPVAQDGQRIGMTAPVEHSTPSGTMRFFLPADVARAGAPKPTDPKVRLTTVPPERVAVLRFSGTAGRAQAADHERALLAALARAGRAPSGQPFLMTYDPPFSVPFLRRNEIAVAIEGKPAA